MDFYALLDTVQDLPRQRGRVASRDLKAPLHLDDDTLEALKEELIEVHHRAVDQDGRMFVWTGDVRPIPGAPSPPAWHQAPRDASSPPLASLAVAPPPPVQRLHCGNHSGRGTAPIRTRSPCVVAPTWAYTVCVPGKSYTSGAVVERKMWHGTGSLLRASPR